MQIIESMPEIRSSISQVSQKFTRKWLLVQCCAVEFLLREKRKKNFFGLTCWNRKLFDLFYNNLNLDSH